MLLVLAIPSLVTTRRSVVYHWRSWGNATRDRRKLAQHLKVSANRQWWLDLVLSI